MVGSMSMASQVISNALITPSIAEELGMGSV